VRYEEDNEKSGFAEREGRVLEMMNSEMTNLLFKN
jgi:hypothetical protein